MKQERVAFYGTELLIVMGEDGQPMVSLRHVCDGIGLGYASQTQKVSANPSFMCYDIVTHDTSGRKQEMLCIPLNQLNGFLFSINANRVKPEIRDQLIKYQQECFEVLHKHFSQKSPSGFFDGVTASALMKTIKEEFKVINDKLDFNQEVTTTSFGDDAAEIEELIKLAAQEWRMTKKEVWGVIRQDCDVSSYKKTTKKIINYLKVRLGGGIKLVDSAQQQQ